MEPVTLYAWITFMHDGNPSIVGAYLPELAAHCPLVGLSRETVERFEPIARAHADSTAQQVYLVKFFQMEVLR